MTEVGGGVDLRRLEEEMGYEYNTIKIVCVDFPKN